MDLLFNQETEDLVLLDGDFKVSDTASDDLVQMLYLRLKTFKREWFWDVTYGIDYLNDVFGIGRNKNTIDAIFRTEINKEILVEEITSFESEIRNNTYACSFKVKVAKENVPLVFYILMNESSIILTTETGLKLKTLL